MNNTATITKTQNAQTLGIYQPTSIDERKASAEFILVNISPNIIRWKNGEKQTVTSRKLSSLQSQFPNWMSDF